MRHLLANPPAVATLLCWQTPNRHRLAIYIWNLIDYMDDDSDDYWPILARKYLRKPSATPTQINGILGVAGRALEKS